MHEFRHRLIAVFAVALAVRVAAVWAVGSYRLDHVTYEHGEIARNLVEGRGFSVRWLGGDGPTSQQAPVYPALVAVFYAVFGVGTPDALLALQLFQCALGAAIAVATALLCRELLPQHEPWAVLAGFGAALYPTLIYAATQVQVATVATLLTVTVLWCAAHTTRTRASAMAIASGVAAGLLALTDPILALVGLVAILMIAVWSACDSAESKLVRLLRAAITAATCLAVIAPWIARNYVVHGEWVFVKSTFGYAFWQGNHPRSFGTDKIPLEPTASATSPSDAHDSGLRALERSLWRSRLIDTLYIDDAVLDNERIANLGRLTEPERSRELLHESLAYVRQHPEHYVRLCAQRLRFFWLFDETNPKSRVAAYRAAHLTLQFLSLFGLAASHTLCRRLWPTYLVVLLVSTFHALTIVSSRFHIPLEPVQFCWCACGVGWLSPRVAACARTILVWLVEPRRDTKTA